jgi:hypothetical protein
MTTKEEMIEIIKAENPNGLRSGNDADGYVDFTPVEYEATIAEWADNRLAKEASNVAKAEAKAQAATDKAALLARLGITEEEAALLLGGTN